MKNVIKAVKKLKLWPRKRRKKKTHEPFYYPPPPCHHCHSCSCSSSSSKSNAQPSAPPLPSWLEAEHNYGTFLTPTAQPIPEVMYPSQVCQAPPQEIVMDMSPSPANPTLPVSSSSSYQQYMVPEAVYGMPVIETARRERSAGQFGCVFSFGAHLFRCLCPCFHIREVV